MGLLDTLSAAWLGWGLLRGIRRGPARELHTLIGLALALAFLLGYSLTTTVRHGLESVTGLGQRSTGLLGAVGIFGGSLYLVHRFRQGLHDAIDRRLSRRANGLWGALAGILRNTLVLLLFIAATDYLPLDAIQQGLIQDSQVGHLYAALFPFAVK